MDDILAEVFSLPFKAIPINAAKETDTTGFFAGGKIYYIIDRVTEFYELQKDEDRNIEYYLLIDKQNGPFLLYHTPTEETYCATCTRNIDSERKLWIRKDVKKEYFKNVYYTTTSGYIVCLKCAKDFLDKWKAFDESLRQSTCEFCGGKFYSTRKITIDGQTYNICNQCLLNNFKFRGYYVD